MPCRSAKWHPPSLSSENGRSISRLSPFICPLPPWLAEKPLRQVAHLVDGVFYSPLDYVWCVRRVLRTICPALVVVFETEIWPNFFAETKRMGAKLAIVNGRISNRTWPRYRRWRALFRPILQLPDLVFVQSTTDQ